ncbi:MAG TPA: RNA polymerase sigma factor [Polyangia bacterium]|nr:RNA polymerase sigma factor [Polyangia bacterium]
MGDDAAPQDLIARLRAGDASAFTQAYQLYAPATFRFLRRLCGASALAEDLFQETWLRLARHARGLRPDTELRAWLYTVARNLARSQARVALADAAGLAALSRWWYLDAPCAAPDEAAIAADTGARLAAALARLSLAGREVLLLVATEGLSVDQAAQILGISPEAARQRLHRARAELARTLKKEEA